MQIEIDAMHTCPRLMDYYGISSNMECLRNIINNLVIAGIPSIIVNYVIGSPLETEDSLNQLLSDSLELYSISRSNLEFNLRFYYDETLDTLSLLEKTNLCKGFARNVVIHETSLSADKLYAFRSLFYQTMMGVMKKELTIEKGLNHIMLSKNKILTQHFIYYYSKSVVNQIYEFRKAGWLFWNEIKYSDFLNYVPTTFSVITRTTRSSTQLSFDPLLSQSLEPFFINETELYIFRLFAFSNQTINRVCHSLVLYQKANSFEDALDKTILFIERLDSIASVLFRKNPLCDQ